jgi:hypothetical protein
MAHSVTITTPRPTFEEIVERLGVSRADRKFVENLVNGKRLRGKAAGASGAGAAKSRAKANSVAMSAAPTKTGERARKTS